MKHVLSMKDCDAVYEMMQDIESEEEKEKLQELVDEYMHYGEYLDVEFDTDTGEIKLLKV